MPLANSISIGLRFIAYVLIKILSGKLAEASPAVIVLAVLFAAKFALAGQKTIRRRACRFSKALVRMTICRSRR
jgi:hypothetical protein